MDRELTITKTCTKCNNTLGLDSFYKSKGYKYGVMAQCKECIKHKAKEYCRSNKAKGNNTTYSNNGAEPTTKTCTRCNTALSLGSFYKKWSGKYGVGSECKKCTMRRNNSYRETSAGKEKLRIRSQSELYREYRRLYRQTEEYKVRHKAYHREYTKSDRYKKYCKEYRESVEGRERIGKYRKSEGHKKAIKKYLLSDKGIASGARARHKRRMSVNGSMSELTYGEWNDIKKKYKYCCVYCGEKKRLTKDCIIPVSKGGSYTKNNVVPACQPCNSKKGNRPVLLQLLSLAGAQS